jgi:hypothetical protein
MQSTCLLDSLFNASNYCEEQHRGAYLRGKFDEAYAWYQAQGIIDTALINGLCERVCADPRA